LDAHLDYFSTHRHNILTANRGALAGDPTVQTIISAELATLRNRMQEATCRRGQDRETAALALRGWLAFIRAVCVEWLQHGHTPREEIHQLCLRALTGLFPELLQLDPPTTDVAAAQARA
jgi:hypothetical protein